MSQHNDILHASIRYTRTEFTALRAWLSGITPETILNLYFSPDDLEDRFPAGVSDLEKFLALMRDDLIARLVDANPLTAEALKKFRVSFRWGKTALDYLVDAADARVDRPALSDPVSAWMRPIAAKRLGEDGIRTLSDLMSAIHRRGKGWYRPIPCLGPGKAKRIEAWLMSHADTLGALPSFMSHADTDQDQPGQFLEGFSTALPSLASFQPATELDGSQGQNRHTQFPLISARNDYDAVQAYLYKFRGRDKTHEAYRKELERFLLWCISERGKAMSNLLVDDCEAYKDFLDNLPERWIGGRRTRNTPEWRPFSGPLSAKSQRYALQCLRACFAWLVNVRYLAANPFVAVSDPLVAKDIHAIQIGKALSADLWAKLADNGGILDYLCELTEEELQERYRLQHFGAVSIGQTLNEQYAPQLRLLRAVILILGATGIRREELAFASRAKLQPYPGKSGLWRLAVLGKRAKWRHVFLTQREIDTLEAHWADRGEDFSFGMAETPLVSPILAPAIMRARQKHEDLGEGKGFSTRGLNKLLSTWRKRIADDELLDLTPAERDILGKTGLHGFRHTMATQVLEGGVSLTTVQKMLGHASLNTTTIYVNSEEQKMAEEFGAWKESKNR